MTFTADEIAAVPVLEPSIESLLRSVDLHEDLFMAFRVQRIKDRELFITMHGCHSRRAQGDF